MMRVLRLKLFQETASYTKPFALKVGETYPLPPYSTVKGMIHEVLKANELIPFRLSIQGDYETIMIDYRKSYFMKDRKSSEFPLILDGLSGVDYSYTTITAMPLYIHLLFNIHLVIHISAKEDVLRNLYEAFHLYDGHISLGRHEDLVRIDEIKFSNLHTVEECDLVHSMYIPKKIIAEEDLTGIPYRLNWTYTIKQGVRDWVKIPSLYVSRGEKIDSELFHSAIQVDEDGFPVFFN
jgi:CRISPR-associated protein Cas5t